MSLHLDQGDGLTQSIDAKKRLSDPSKGNFVAISR